VISMIGLEGEAQRQRFISQLQMALFGWFKKHPARDVPLGGLLVMDEAQTIAPSGALTPSTHSTLALASQARKYGLGLIFATQAPRGLNNRIPGNASTQFYGRLNAPVQIQTAREIARGAGGDVADIGTLGIGQFYVGVGGEPFVKIQASMPLSNDGGPLSPEEVLQRARAGRVGP
jgi:DNA helicase HerA-like ATPase